MKRRFAEAISEASMFADSFAWTQKVGSWVIRRSAPRSTAARSAWKLAIQVTRTRRTSRFGSPRMMRSTVVSGFTQSASARKWRLISMAVIVWFLAQSFGLMILQASWR